MNKSQEAVKKSKENYELALLDITNYNSRYQEVSQSKYGLHIEFAFPFQDMTDVFERCQRKEAQPLQIFIILIQKTLLDVLFYNLLPECYLIQVASNL